MSIIRVAELSCDSKMNNKYCDSVIHICGTNIVSLINQARKMGWAVARDRSTCYCPKCAEHYRTGVKRW